MTTKTDLTIRRNQVAELFQAKSADIASLMPADTQEKRQQLAERLISTTKNALVRNPDLYKCTPASIVKACMNAAQDGLVIDGREAALVMFKRDGIEEAQYMPMYRGLLKLAYNTGKLASIEVYLVYEKEVNEGKFRYIAGTDPKIVHEPIFMGDRGSIVAAYAVAKLTNGGIVQELMTIDELEAVRSKSRGKNGPWSDEKVGKPEMYKKTVLKRTCKRLPFSTESREDAKFLEAVQIDDGVYEVDGAESPDALAPVKKQSAAERVNAAAAREAEYTEVHDADGVLPDEPPVAEEDENLF